MLNFGHPTNNTLYGDWEIDFSELGTGWERITKQHSAVTEIINWITPANNLTGTHFRPSSGTTETFNFYLWGVQQELSSDDSTGGYITNPGATAVSGMTGVTRGVNGTTAGTAVSGTVITIGSAFTYKYSSTT